MSYHCIVIGNPIAHSKSPELHQAFAKQTHTQLMYRRQHCPNDDASFTAVVEAFFAGGGTGANVTVPFKEMAFNLCQRHGGLSDYALAAGAVNTLALCNGKLYGDNTDGRGLVNHMHQLGWQLKGQRVLVLGAGGASRGILLPLMEAGIRAIHIANRTLSKAQTLITDLSPKQVALSASSLADIPLADYDVVINATSIGLSGDALPFRKDLIAAYAYDMMYGKPSAFLDFFTQQGATTSDGLGMLIHQGALSFGLWTGKPVDLAKLSNPFA